MKNPCKICLVKAACRDECEKKQSYDGWCVRRRMVIAETLTGALVMIGGVVAFVFVVFFVGLGAR